MARFEGGGFSIGSGANMVELAVADSTQALAYEEALRGVVQQQSVLTDIRGRAATLLAAASISISFLGGIALRDRKPSGLGWTAVGGFVAVGLLVIWMLLPRQGWTFRMSARLPIKDYVEAEAPADLPGMYRDLALHLERHFDANQRRLDQLFWLLRAASCLLVIDIVLWLLIIAGR